MKRIILSIVAISIMITSFAQEKIDYFQKKNEINIQVDDIFAKQNFLDYYYYELDNNYEYALISYYYPDLTNTPAVGLGYKHHFIKGALRLKGSFSMLSRTYENDKDDENDDIFIASYNERFSAGYEIQKNWGRTQVFFGLDAVVGFQSYINKQKTRLYDDNYGSLGDYVDSKYITANISYGIQPFLGFKYMISPHFSVSTEYHILMERFRSKSKYEVEGEDTQDGNKTTGMNFKFGPKGQITFSYHF